MKKKNIYIKLSILIILLIIIFSLLFFLQRNYFTNNNLEKSIFGIYSENKIKLDQFDFKNSKTQDYKEIINVSKIWNWFFINNKWNFLTNSHLFDNTWSKYYIIIDNNKYTFEIINEYKEKDLILGKIKNYKNKNYLRIISNYKQENFEEIYTYKNENRIKWDIIWINKNIEELKLNNLIETNLKLKSWDSWSPLLNKKNKVLWIFTFINKNNNNSYAQIINYSLQFEK